MNRTEFLLKQIEIELNAFFSSKVAQRKATPRELQTIMRDIADKWDEQATLQEWLEADIKRHRIDLRNTDTQRKNGKVNNR